LGAGNFSNFFFFFSKMSKTISQKIPENFAAISPAKINTDLIQKDGKTEYIPVIINGRTAAHLSHGADVVVQPKYFEAVVQAAKDSGISCNIRTSGYKGAVTKSANASEEISAKNAEIEKLKAELDAAKSANASEEISAKKPAENKK
jgi:hypothetical protein